MADALINIDFPQLWWPDVSVLEMFIRGTAVYLGLFILLRMLRRPAGQLGIADVLLITVLADASQNAMGGPYESIASGLVLILTIAGWDQLIDHLSYRWSWFARMVEPPPALLVWNGQLRRRELHRHQLSEEEVMSHLRQQGVDSISKVKRCFLEGDGSISVIKRKQTKGKGAR